MWWSSLVPEQFSMGTMAYGGGPDSPAHQHGAGIDMSTLTASAGEPNVSLDLTARAETFQPATGRSFTGYTFKHTCLSPTVPAHRRDLVQVVLHDLIVADGVTLHGLGVDVPALIDRVADLTQDATTQSSEPHTAPPTAQR